MSLNIYIVPIINTRFISFIKLRKKVYILKQKIKKPLFLLILFIGWNYCGSKAKTCFSDINKKVIYLTFDDGPSNITNNILDTLKENNVKATFFIIGNQIDGLEDVIKRIHD